MRIPVLLALLMLLAPAAGAAALELEGPRSLEADAAWQPATFEVPFRATQDGAAYAKLLPTPGNAVNDGSGPNASGWRVTFALARADGAQEELGERADGSPTALAPVRAGESLRLLVTVHPPATVPAGTQKVHVALAYRAPGAQATASGASLDEARAVTLLLRFADPTAGPGGATPPTPDVGPIPTTGTGGSGSAAAPPVIVVRESTPWWLLAATLGVLALALAVLAAALVVLARAMRVVRAGQAVRVPVRGEAPPVEQPADPRYPR